MEKITITVIELADIINETTLESKLNFWQKSSDYQKGLLRNLKEKGFDLLSDDKNNMKKLELIRKKCIEANPEILALEFGCIVKLLEEIEFPQYNFTDTFIFMTQSGGGRIADTEDFFDYSILLLEPVSNEIYKDDCYPEMEIIGRPITIADVLIAIDPFGNWGCIAGHIAKIDRKNGSYDFKVKWNLKESLENQSEETIDFIYNLLK